MSNLAILIQSYKAWRPLNHHPLVEKLDLIHTLHFQSWVNDHLLIATYHHFEVRHNMKLYYLNYGWTTTTCQPQPLIWSPMGGCCCTQVRQCLKKMVESYTFKAIWNNWSKWYSSKYFYPSQNGCKGRNAKWASFHLKKRAQYTSFVVVLIEFRNWNFGSNWKIKRSETAVPYLRYAYSQGYVRNLKCYTPDIHQDLDFR